MKLRRLIRLAIATLVVAGLTLASLASPVAARWSSMSQSAMQTMAQSGMSCCPDDQKSKDCQDCPLMAMCVLKATQAGPSTADALPLRHAIGTTHSVLDDVLADGLDRPPLDHPPRSLI